MQDSAGLRQHVSISLFTCMQDSAGLSQHLSISLFTCMQDSAGLRQHLSISLFTCMQDSAGLRQQYPGRIMTARYEDLSERPLYFTQRLLSFAGLEMTPDLQQYVLNITSSGVEVKAISNTTIRSDSKRTASQWRANGTPFAFAANIDKHCADVYGHMGYFPLHDDRELKNLSVSVYKDVKDIPWLWSP